MAIARPFKITYGSLSVGGASTSYYIHATHQIDKRFDSLRLVFDVIVVGTSRSDFQDKCAALETAFRKRDQSLTIDLDNVDDPAGDSVFTYTYGTDILNVSSSCAKSGNEQTDRGLSRAYTCSIEAELPADDQQGLRDVEVLVEYEAGRQKIVTMRGVYTALSGASALAQYQSDFDTEAGYFLTLVDSGATFELVQESSSLDRNKSDSTTPFPHLCSFQRQYVELLANQADGTLDDTEIRDHRLVFTDLSQHPGDSGENVYRLRRVIGTYDCAVDIDQTTDLQSVFDTKIKAYVLSRFESTFNPIQFAVEEMRSSFDETRKRISSSLQIIYQKSGGDDVVEAAETFTIREQQQIDYTFIHNGEVFDAVADKGWAIRERVRSHTTIILGALDANSRIGPSAGYNQGRGVIHPTRDPFYLGANRGGQEVQRSGWNLVANTSQVTPQWIGDPDHGQIRLTVLNETITERYNEEP